MPFMVMKNPKGWTPEGAIWDALGCKPGTLPIDPKTGKTFKVKGNWVLVAVYISPDETAGGIKIADVTLDEQKNQGKSCMVIGKGANAFKSDQYYQFAEGDEVNIGDWIALWVYEARPMPLRGVNNRPVACRLIKDTDIHMEIPGPDWVF
jgi:co-chaperonin GroES (HSP10)